MRDTRGMRIDQERYQAAMRKGNLAMMLHWHKKLTAKYINAEWETKQDLLSTVDQLEEYCESLESRLLLLVPFAIVLLVVGAVWGNDVMFNILMWLAYG